MEQLDEHLSGATKYSPPSFIQIGSTFFIYLLILTVSFISYYAAFESFGLFDFLYRHQRDSEIPSYDITVFLALYFIFVISNYYLQGRLYNLLGQSVLQTTLIPMLFWGTIIVIAFLYDPYQGIPFPNLFVPFLRISTALILYGLFSFIIALYFKHQNKTKYCAALFAHWLLCFFVFSCLP